MTLHLSGTVFIVHFLTLVKSFTYALLIPITQNYALSYKCLCHVHHIYVAAGFELGIHASDANDDNEGISATVQVSYIC